MDGREGLAQLPVKDNLNIATEKAITKGLDKDGNMAVI